ncbi:MAG: hypothetical protein M3343_11910 [Actinomycetota bacterium]|nr:hypothetical protein [Actinomycetota bacterium]
MMVTCVLAPLRHNWGKRPVDGFPLSYYPMFSAKREATAKVTYLVGLDGRGDRIKIPYKCAGSGGLNQVRRQIRRAVRRGHSEELCARVAREVRRRNSFKEVVTVQVVTGTYHLDDYFSGRNRQPLKEKLHASVPVEPGRARPGTGAAPTLLSGSSP